MCLHRWAACLPGRRRGAAIASRGLVPSDAAAWVRLAPAQPAYPRHACSAPRQDYPCLSLGPDPQRMACTLSRQIKLASYETNGGAAEVRSVVATVYNSGYSGAIDDVQDDIALMLLNKPSSVPPVKIAPGEGRR